MIRRAYLLLILCVAAGTLWAESPRRSVARGNRAYDKGDYENAVADFEKTLEEGGILLASECL